MNGKRLKSAIKQSGLKQLDVARILGVTGTTVSRWIMGIREPDDGMKARLAELLGVPLAVLMEDDPNAAEAQAEAAPDAGNNDEGGSERAPSVPPPDPPTVLGGFITEGRKKLGLNVEDLAEKLGISAATLTRYEQGERMPALLTLRDLIEILGFTDEQVARLGITRAPDTPAKIVPSPELREYLPPLPGEATYRPVRFPGQAFGSVRAPVYGSYAAACAGYGNNTNAEFIPENYIELPSAVFGGIISQQEGKEPFLVEVSGSSMVEAGIEDGDYVTVNPAAEVTDGDVVLCYLDGDRFIKYIFWTGGKSGYLRSASDEYPRRPFTDQDVDSGNFYIYGKVISHISFIKGYRGKK